MIGATPLYRQAVIYIHGAFCLFFTIYLVFEIQATLMYRIVLRMSEMPLTRPDNKSCHCSRVDNNVRLMPNKLIVRLLTVVIVR